jgi:arsenate reductase
MQKNNVLENLYTAMEDTVAKKTKILFICQHNSGRSQIAEAFLKKFYGDHFDVESAGLEPASAVNPLVVKAMMKVGFDLSENRPQSVFELFKRGKIYEHVITVCHDTESKCPIFPGITKRWHWPFPDPATVEGTEQEKLVKVREIRDTIKEWILDPPEGTIDFKALAEKKGA